MKFAIRLAKAATNYARENSKPAIDSVAEPVIHFVDTWAPEDKAEEEESKVER